MDVANAVAAPTANLYMLDLVSFKSKYCIILSSSTWLSHPADELSMLRFDGQPFTKEAGDTDVVLIDRSFLHVGQAVVSASDIAGQIGVVTGVTTTLDLVDRATGEVIRGLPPSALQRVRALCLGDYVVYGQGQWLGRVVEVSLDVDVMFDDGAVCRITDAESPTKQLWPAESGSGLHRKQTNTSFYPGLPITSGDPSIVFKGARWLSGHWNKRREQVGTVTKVEMAGVLVRWIASAYGDTDEQFLHESAPPAYLSPENLTYFCPAYGCSWAVGDHCFLRESESSLLAAASASSEMDAIHDQRQQSSLQSDDSSSSDEEEHVEPSLIVGSETAPKEEKRDYRKQLRKPMFIGQRGRARQSYQWSAPLRTLTVSCTRTTIDVLWQDGSRQHEVPSTYLNPFEMMNEHEVFPGQYVIDARDDGVTGESTGRRVGVVKNLNSKDYTAHVSWFKAASDSWEVECGNEAISVYDLGSDPNHTIFYGDVVVRTISSNMRGNAPQPQSQVSDLSWVGHVVDFCDGHIQVKWGDDTMSMVLPHEISVASKEHYSQLEAEMGDWVEEDGVDTHQETGAADVDNDPADATNIQGGRVEHGGSCANESDGSAAATGTNRLAGVIRSMILSVVQTLAGAKLYLANIGSSSTSDLPDATMQDVVQVPAHVSVSGSHEYHSIGGAATEAVFALAARNNENGDGDVEDAVRSGEAVTGGDDTLKFPNFDIVKTPTDHHYLDTMNQGSGGNRWVKKVQKEWKILEESLPDTIYVRAYEDRMDLLRVAMVGASGTPYQHGLFFFDLQLPPSYPAVPPQVYYRSFGLRVNPNLYPSGTVCLSLLNTFGGEGTEVWSPGTSSLLQVVVSLQALVLNDQPYYNEAGHDALVDTPEGHRNALPYSENAFLLTLRTALHLLRQPPRGFEGFITDHFHERGRLVLAACEGYLRGCVPTADEGAMELPCTAGFRIALANLVPRLVAAFTLKDTTTSDTKKVSQVKL